MESLGIIIDCKLDWKQQISAICKRSEVKYPLLGHVLGSVFNNRIFLSNINPFAVIIAFSIKLVIF